jgi:hypothetical protein
MHFPFSNILSKKKKNERRAYIKMLLDSGAGFFFTAGYRAVYRGNHSYSWGTVTVPSGRNPKNSNVNLNSKK